MKTKAKDIMNAVNAAMGSTVLRSGSDSAFKVTYIETGLLPIDVLLAGGIPRGRSTVIVGDWSTLKSLIGLYAIRAVQHSGGVAALIDTERAFDPDWATEVGVNVDDLLIWPPRDDPEAVVSGELAIDIAQGFAVQEVDLIVFDSVAATLPEQERDKRLHGEKVQPGRLAALMSVGLRKLTASNNQTAFIWINQLREQIGITFGNPEKATGGRALPYYASLILQTKKAGKMTRPIKYHTGEKWESGKETIGQKFKAELHKSKLSKPHREVFFDWLLEDGTVDEIGFMIAQGMEHGFMTLKGSTWSHEGWKAVGREKWRKMIQATPALYESLYDATRDANGLPPIKRALKVGPKPIKATATTPKKKLVKKR